MHQAHIQQKHAFYLPLQVDERKSLIELYLKTPARSKADLDLLIKEVMKVSSYFSKLAREKSVYATESTFAFEGRPLQKDMHLCEMMSNDELTSMLAQLSEQEFTLRVVVPCLERAGFTNVRYCHGPSEKGCDLLYDYLAPMGAVFRYGAQIKTKKIHTKADTSGNIKALINQAQSALSSKFYDVFTRKSYGIDQYWIICPYDMTSTAKSVLSSEIGHDLKHAIRFLVGQTLIDKLKRYVPVLLDGMISEKLGKSS
ncbi:MAG: hypothetical protein MUO27_01345 [Sedimentisphaerales bacterium]|nr:hypothetical protein [Sedimentisphaerales bacterium]